MAALLPVAFAVGTATQAVGGVMAARERSAAAGFEQQQYKIQEQQYLTAAARDEATRRANLNSSIDTIMAIRSGRGVGESSPTANAILQDITQRSESDIAAQKTNLLTKADEARMAGDFAERRKRMALLQGDIGAVGTLANAGVGWYKLKRGYGYGGYGD